MIVFALIVVIIILVIGYRDQVRRITVTANYNAGAWAEAEAKLHAAEIDLAQVDVLARAEMKRGDELARIAREALQVAHGREFDDGTVSGNSYIKSGETITAQWGTSPDPLDADEIG